MATIYKTVSEVVVRLRDRSYADRYIVQVNKGSEERPRLLDVIEWHTAVRMLDEVFGPFGYDLEITGSHSDYANGLYTVDLKLTGRAIDDETGEVVTLVRPGRGLGLVPRSALQSDAEHDRQAHGAKSDAITNATKALGDGFGLHLYGKKTGQQGQRHGQQSAPASSGSSSGYTRPAGTGSTGTGRKGPSEKQMKVLVNNGYPEDFVGTLEFKDWKGIVDAIFSGTTPPIVPPAAPAAPASNNGRATARPAAAAEEPDEIPF